MGNDERSDTDYQSNWRFKLVVMVGAAAGIGLPLLLGAVADHFGYRPSPPWGLIGGLIMVTLGVSVGIVLGQRVGERLFRPRD